MSRGSLRCLLETECRDERQALLEQLASLTGRPLSGSDGRQQVAKEIERERERESEALQINI